MASRSIGRSRTASRIPWQPSHEESRGGQAGAKVAARIVGRLACGSLLYLSATLIAGRCHGQANVAKQPELTWRRADTSIALLDGDHVVWQFNFGDELNVPRFHPLAAAGGRVLTWDQPPDHVWHHALWFCWKYINGVNYWEHNSQTGKPDGRTSWRDVEVEERDDRTASISMRLSYQPADGGEAVLDERRRIQVSRPDADGVYRIDWTSQFTAAADATLDRTPPTPQSPGGYAGLSVRFARGFAERRASDLGGPVDFGQGNRYRGRSGAMEYNGLIGGTPVGLAILNHPGNPRAPTPWYLIRGPLVSYVNAALLNDQPLQLAAGEQMTLRYRLIVHPDRWSAERLRAAYAEFTETATSSSNE